MLATYQTVISCSQSREVLQAVMENAVDRYLSLHPTVFPIDRQDLAIDLKVQKSYRSSGEIITISIAKESFYIASESIAKHNQSERPRHADKYMRTSPLFVGKTGLPLTSSIAWGKNRDNVLNLSNYVREAIAELSYNVART